MVSVCDSLLFKFLNDRSSLIKVDNNVFSNCVTNYDD